MNTKKTLNTLLASAVALTIAGAAGAAHAQDEAAKEKCYGVVKAGHNDCANASKTHSCAGHATVDGSGEDWITLPAGVCEKLVGGSLEPYSDEAEAASDDAEHSEHGESHE